LARERTPVSFWSSVSLGIGAMIGAGIFALLGEAGAIAGAATWLSFVLGGIVALASGYSMGKLGARYPSAGGVVEFLTQAWGPGTMSGAMSIALYLAALVALSLISKAFGSYAAQLFFRSTDALTRDLFTVGVIAAFCAVNLRGAREVALWERVTVAVKYVVLVAFGGVGLCFAHRAWLAPALYPPPSRVVFSVAITFFAYEGFRVIANAAEDMAAPRRELPRAFAASILLVMLLYVLVALAVFGSLPVERVIAAKDYALAEAARPVFGELGYVVVAMTALVSTASAINASLYAVTNVTYQLAKQGELPAAFGAPIAHSREGLVISSLLIVAFALFFNLSQIAALGSLSILVVHLFVHLGHLRLLPETGARGWLVVAAVALTGGAIATSIYFELATSPWIVGLLALLFPLALGMERILRHFGAKRIVARIDGQGAAARGR
jgi:amino acid transporter